MEYYNNTLAHHGINGMRWGVRRFENKYGTLTEAGKKRYHKGSDSSYKKKHKKSAARKVRNVALATLATSTAVVAGVAVANRILNDHGHESVNHMLYRNHLNTKKSFEMAWRYITKT